MHRIESFLLDTFHTGPLQRDTEGQATAPCGPELRGVGRGAPMKSPEVQAFGGVCADAQKCPRETGHSGTGALLCACQFQGSCLGGWSSASKSKEGRARSTPDSIGAAPRRRLNAHPGTGREDLPDRKGDRTSQL